MVVEDEEEVLHHHKSEVKASTIIAENIENMMDFDKIRKRRINNSSVCKSGAGVRKSMMRPPLDLTF